MEKVEHFNFLRERMKWNPMDKKSFEDETRKVELVFQTAMETNHKNSLEIQN